MTKTLRTCVFVAVAVGSLSTGLYYGQSGYARGARAMLPTIEMYEQRQDHWIHEINRLNELMYGPTPNPIPAERISSNQEGIVRVRAGKESTACEVAVDSCVIERSYDGGKTWARILKP